jgi:hypothetical protein
MLLKHKVQSIIPEMLTINPIPAFVVKRSPNTAAETVIVSNSLTMPQTENVTTLVIDISMYSESNMKKAMTPPIERTPI